ncbi:MAG: putative ABC transport system substrate-binding protein [Rhodocyclaceae bacterium]|nr:MAG: putative ABC transport system substrate-binding protein [Rhodocyclaceae bacterium]TNC99881.1 MAG: putative ABC transport system substrate-binding protein [Rhodocyclaceae bacterium]
METDKHYFFEGLFIIVFSIAAALFAVWLGSSGRHDDVIYRINFPESVSGLTAGDTVKFHGVDVGTVKSMAIDPENPRLVRVDVRLRKEAPVKTDTRASLTLKGITGVVFIELNGGDPAARTLLAVTPENQVPEIPSEKTGLNAMLDELPKLVKKFSAIEDQVKKVVTSVGGLTEKVKDNPSLLLRRPARKPD